jgi:putative endonuclease
MDVLRAAKTLLARFAGAPLPSRPNGRDEARDRSARRSSLYVPEDPARARRTSRQRSGDDAEAYARRYLECAGLTFVAANVRFRDGEIDLVMRDAPQPRLATPALIFVEVRLRGRDEHGGAAASVTRAKRRRIVAAAAHYLVGLGLRTLPPVRFDVVTIDGDAARGWRVAWIRGAFRDEG